MIQLRHQQPSLWESLFAEEMAERWEPWMRVGDELTLLSILVLNQRPLGEKPMPDGISCNSSLSVLGSWSGGLQRIPPVCFDFPGGAVAVFSCPSDGALQRMQPRATPEMMRLRRSTVEHPFASLKYHIFGNPRFLLRGLQGAQTEISLAAMVYNLRRMMNVLGANRRWPDNGVTSMRDEQN